MRLARSQLQKYVELTCSKPRRKIYGSVHELIKDLTILQYAHPYNFDRLSLILSYLTQIFVVQGGQ